MSAAFTAGPWRVVEQSQELQIWQHRLNGKMLLSSCVAITNGRITALARADARLIAAAPDLLAACRLIVSAFDALKPSNAARNEPLQINAARAAIAKATGVAA